MTARPVRIGILGAARIAPAAIIEPARERTDVRVALVAARHPARARRFAEEHGLEGIARDYAELVGREDLDLIYIALPPDRHCQWAIAALEAGRAVLCEKPFAIDSVEAQAMVDAALGAGGILIEGFHYRFHPLMQQAVTLVREDGIGEPRRATASVQYPITACEGEPRWSARHGGGAMMDLGCYAVHALRSLLGGEPDVVEAFARHSRGVDAETTARLRFSGDVEAVVHAAMDSDAPFSEIVIEGARGRLQINGFVLPHRSGRMQLTVDQEIHEIPIARETSYAAQLDHVLRVLRREEAQITGGEDAVANLRVIDRIRALSATG